MQAFAYKNEWVYASSDSLNDNEPMALSQAIMTALIEDDMSGYELAQSFDSSLGLFWRASHQQIYQELKKLSEQQLLNKREVSQSGKPNKIVYGLTLLGREALQEWVYKESKVQEAKDDRESAEARLQEYEAKLADAGTRAGEIVDQSKRDAEKARASIEEKARDESDKMVERARREIELAKQSAIKDLYASSSEMATEIASRILQRELNAQDHERLIADSIQELGDLDKN